MTTREKIIVGFMCLTIAYGAYELIGPRTTRKAAPRPAANPMEETRKFVSEVTQKMAKGKIGKEFQYMVAQAGADWTRDPFLQSTLPLKEQLVAQAPSRKQSESTAPGRSFAFTGFLQIGKTKLAVINGTEYAVGEALEVSGYYLKNVSAEKATISRIDGSETIQIPLTELD